MKSASRPFLRSPFNYDPDTASARSGLECTLPSLAQQQFREECDINTITSRFGLTGEVPTAAVMPSYDDYTGISDFQTAMNTVKAAEAAFLAVPAAVRARFSNDPQLFLEFCADPANLEEARRLGLAPPAPSQAPGGTPTPPNP